MLDAIAVGVPTHLGAAGGWDPSPLLAFIFVIALVRRALRSPLTASTVFIASMAALASPAVVDALGNAVTVGLALLVWLVARAVRRPTPPPSATRV